MPVFQRLKRENPHTGNIQVGGTLLETVNLFIHIRKKKVVVVYFLYKNRDIQHHKSFKFPHSYIVCLEN